MKKQQQASGINPANLQEMLDSASNALDQGQRQWFTPPEYAAAFHAPFAPLRAHAVCDLQMGSGSLLAASRCAVRLGADIDADCGVKPKGAKGSWRPVTADLTKFADLLDEAGFSCDLFALNPPFSLKWEKERFAFLSQSTRPAVQQAFDHAKGRSLDSSLATLMLALHFSTVRGEGFTVMNAATAGRLLGPPGMKATSPLRDHVWLWLEIPGTIFTGTDPALRVAVLYFAADHRGENPRHLTMRGTSWMEAEQVLTAEADTRWRHRGGIAVTQEREANYGGCDRWADAVHEWKALHSDKPDWNIWLDADGTIRRYLTPFQQVSGRIPRHLVQRLDELHGQHPQALVVQKSTREALLGAVHSEVWRVDPALPPLIDRAIAEYNAVRAPFFPLSEVQRIGYLDENSLIECKRAGLNGFEAGKKYELSSKTIPIQRTTQRANFAGTMDDIEITGEDLLITIRDGDTEHHFVHQPDMVKDVRGDERKSLHDLQKLVEHFTIPEVPDIARLRPAEYQAALERLTDIELRAGKLGAPVPEPASSLGKGAGSETGAPGAFKFRRYQIDDLARGSLHNGLILAWQAGMGKTFAAFAWPMVKGSRVNLIVAPDSLHQQITDEGLKWFGIRLKPLMSQKDFYRDAEMAAVQLAHMQGREYDGPEVWRITSYTALGMNGGDEWEPRFGEDGGEMLNAERMARRAAIPGWEPGFAQGIGEKRIYENPHQDETNQNLHRHAQWQETHPAASGPDGSIAQSEHVRTLDNETPEAGMRAALGGERLPGIAPVTIRCVLFPTLSTLVGQLFRTVVVDEGVRMKSTDAYIARGVRNLTPDFRLVLTATPIKNRLEDIFWLAHWACGGTAEPNPRFPYEDSNEARERFANTHQLMERNVTKEQAASRAGRRRSFVKRTAEICNIHWLWKLLGPVVIRRRKDGVGEDIVPKIVIPVRVRPGKSQQAVYQWHINNPPQFRRGTTVEIQGPAVITTQLTLLRQAALSPDSPALREFGGGTSAASWTQFNTKVATALSIIVERLQLGEQVILMSPFQHASKVIHERLTEAGVTACLLDGNISAEKRGIIAKQFKQQRYAVMVAGQKAMGEGHSFECCPNLIRLSLDWAFDINDQCADRVHRLTSPKPVRIYDLITENTMDERLFQLYHEKGDGASLALDGQLFTERTEEVNLAQLFMDAIASFDPSAETIDEQTIEDEWPGLRAKLRAAEAAFRQWWPPLTVPLHAEKGDAQMTLGDLNHALRQLHAPAARVRNNPRPAPRFTGTANDALADLLASLDGREAPDSAELRERIHRRK